MGGCERISLNSHHMGAAFSSSCCGPRLGFALAIHRGRAACPMQTPRAPSDCRGAEPQAHLKLLARSPTPSQAFTRSLWLSPAAGWCSPPGLFNPPNSSQWSPGQSGPSSDPSWRVMESKQEAGERCPTGGGAGAGLRLIRSPSPGE